jgi:methylthioribulose-1-phosphate dehydratase
VSTPDPLADLAAEGRRLAGLGFMACTAGNLSTRLPSGTVAMSPSGVDKGSLVPADFILLGEDGRPQPPDTRKPSDETALHLSLYGRVSCGAVCHGHPPHAVALSLGAASAIRVHGIEMEKAFAGIPTHERELLLPVIENSQDMAELSRHALAALRPDVPAVLVRGHGVYAWGKSPKEAARHLETVEWLCRLLWLCRAARIEV